MRSTSKGRDTVGARLSKVQATYRSKTRASYLAAGAAAAMAIVLALWVIPWVPIGMTLDDYSSVVWVALVLGTGSALMGLLAFFTREPASTERDVAEVWRGLLGKGVRLWNRHQFYRRLARECERAQRDGRSPLALMLVRVSPSDDRDGSGRRDAVERIAQAAARNVRSSDVIGLIGGEELGVLVIGVNDQARQAIGERLERTLTAALAEWPVTKAPGRAPVVSMGASTLGPDGDPDSLIAAARQALKPLAVTVGQAA